MSVIRKKPFIESVLNTLTTSELSSLKYVMDNGGNNVNVSLVSGSFEKGEGKIITSTITPVYIELEQNKFYSAILIWNASYCVAIPYHRFQDVKLIKINSSTRTYEEIKEYCDINELRRIIDDTAESSFDADGEAGQILTADGEGGVQWKNNPQIIALTTTSGTLTSDQVALASAGNTVITLSGEYYYRFSKSNSTIVFKATPRVDSGTTYIDNITIDLSDNTYSASYETVATGEGFTPTYDDELSDSSTNAVQNKVVNAALAEKADVTDLEDYAKKDGNYPTMTVGAADNLTPYDESAGDDQDEPFSFQATGTGNGSQADFATGALALMKEKRGNSVVVNQLIVNQTYTDDNHWAVVGGTVSMSGDLGVFTPTQSGANFISEVLSMISGNKYLVCASIKLSNGTSGVGIRLSEDTTQSASVQANTNQQFISFIGTATQDNRVQIIDTRASDWGTIQFNNIYCIDLTQWFNGSIPQDLLDHPENFFRYYQGSLAYNAGQIVNANSRYIKCIGRNQFNGIWANNTALNVSTGATGEQNNFSTSDYIKIIPNRDIYYRIDAIDSYMAGTHICYYDKDKNFIKGYTHQVTANFWNRHLVSPANVVYVRFDSGSAYKDSVCVSLYYEGESGYDEYYQYEVLTNNDTGTETLRSISSSVFDSKAPDGTITTRVGTRAYESGDENDNNVLTDGTTTYYALATPTTSQGTPYSANLVIDDFGSMEFAGTSGVPQGNLIFYPVDYKAFVDTLYDYTEGTPSNLALKSDLTVVDNKIGAKIPECPTTTDGTYVLKATVSGGVVTYNWVLEE